MRTYSFDHFQADKPEPSTTNPGGAEQTPPAEQSKPHLPPSEEGQLHYGRKHAQTAELYQKHREERERAEQMGTAAVEEPQAPAVEAREQEEVAREEPAREDLKLLARQAVASVLQAAREAAKGRPLVGARKLAGDVLTGARRVAREVSAHRGRQPSGKRGTGKRR